MVFLYYVQFISLDKVRVAMQLFPRRGSSDRTHSDVTVLRHSTTLVLKNITYSCFTHTDESIFLVVFLYYVQFISLDKVRVAMQLFPCRGSSDRTHSDVTVLRHSTTLVLKNITYSCFTHTD